MTTREAVARQLGREIEKWLEIRGMTQTQVERRAELASGSVGRFLNQSRCPSVPTLTRIAVVLDVAVLIQDGAITLADKIP